MFRTLAVADLNKLTPEHICVIKPSALGDVVQALPLLPVLKACYPSASITWVINRELKDLVEGHPNIDGVIPFDRRGKWGDWIQTLNVLRSKRFDLVFDLQGLFRSAVMTMATGARVRVGLQTAREASSLANNCIIPDTGRDVAAHARLWRVAEALGYADHPKEVVITTSDADRTWADAILLELPRPVIAVHPGAGWETKRWPVERFAQLLSLYAQTWGGSTIILGSRGERPEAERLHGLLAESTEHAAKSSVNPSNIVNLAGETSLKQLTQLLRQVDCVASNDSGPMHLAAGLETPTLGLFTCTSAIQSGPAGSIHELVSTTVSCAASYCKRCPQPGENYLACMKELDVDRVWLALQRLLLKNKLINDPLASRDIA